MCTYCGGNERCCHRTLEWLGWDKCGWKDPANTVLFKRTIKMSADIYCY